MKTCKECDAGKELHGIKPLITFTEQGAVVMDGRAHGQKKALRALADTMKKDAIDENFPGIGYRFCKLKIFYCARHKKLTEPTGRCEFWKRRTLKYKASVFSASTAR